MLKCFPRNFASSTLPHSRENHAQQLVKYCGSYTSSSIYATVSARVKTWVHLTDRLWVQNLPGAILWSRTTLLYSRNRWCFWRIWELEHLVAATHCLASSDKEGALRLPLPQLAVRVRVLLVPWHPNHLPARC